MQQSFTSNELRTNYGPPQQQQQQDMSTGKKLGIVVVIVVVCVAIWWFFIRDSLSVSFELGGSTGLEIVNITLVEEDPLGQKPAVETPIKSNMQVPHRSTPVKIELNMSSMQKLHINFTNDGMKPYNGKSTDANVYMRNMLIDGKNHMGEVSGDRYNDFTKNQDAVRLEHVMNGNYYWSGDYIYTYNKELPDAEEDEGEE